MDSELLDQLGNLQITSNQEADNILMLGEKGLSKVLEVSYISKNHLELLQLLLDTHDGNDHTKAASNNGICVYLDKFRNEIIGTIPWKSQLQDKCGELTHYEEFLARRKGGCDTKRKSSDKHPTSCLECNMDSQLLDTPSSLVRLIRNLHAHAAQKIQFNPNGVIEKILFPNGHSDKRQFVDYWMTKSPKLFHINAALKYNQIDWLDWSSDSVSDQVLEGLNKALNFERDHGGMIEKFECNSMEDGSKCKLEVLISDIHLSSKKFVKVLTVSGSSLTVTHGSEETLTYPVNNPRCNQFNVVFGLDQLNNTTVRSKCVILVVNQYQSLDKIWKCLQQFGNFRKVPFKWSDISGSAQRQIQSTGTVEIQNQKYPACTFSLANLAGKKLNKFLQTGNLKLFEHEIRQPTYVKRWFSRPPPSLEQDAAFFVIDTCYMWGRDAISHFVSSEQELHDLTEITHKFVILQFHACFDKAYTKLIKLASGRKSFLLEFGPDSFRTEAGVSRDCLVELILEDEIFRKETANLVFISGGSGQGKTSYIQHLAETLHIPDTVVVHTYAPDLVSRSNKTLDIPVMDALAESCGFPKLETEILKHLKVLLLIDALDEVEDKKIKHANNLIRYFLTGESVRLVVSVRTYLLSKLHKFPSHELYKLSKLTDAGKIEICVSYWKSLNKQEEPKKSTAEHIVSSYKYFLLLSPLECVILADIHTEDAFNQAKEADAFQPLNPIDMYKSVMKKNFHRYLTCKKNVAENNVEDDIYARLEDEYKLAHVYLAIQSLTDFNPERLMEPLKHPDIRLTQGQGFLDNMDPVRFSHRVFAEFFLDTWVYDVLSGEFKIKEKYVTAFSELFKARYFGIPKCKRSFLEKMLQDRKEPLYFHFDMELFDLEIIARLSYNTPTPTIYKTLVLSFEFYSPEVFGEKLRKLEAANAIVDYPDIRPYNGIGPIIPLVCRVALYADVLFKWLCMGGRPSEFLELCPDGFYLEKTSDDALSWNNSEYFITYRMCYIPEDSEFAKNKDGFPRISREYLRHRSRPVFTAIDTS